MSEDLRPVVLGVKSTVYDWYIAGVAKQNVEEHPAHMWNLCLHWSMVKWYLPLLCAQGYKWMTVCQSTPLCSSIHPVQTVTINVMLTTCHLDCAELGYFLGDIANSVFRQKKKSFFGFLITLNNKWGGVAIVNIQIYIQNISRV